MQGARRSAVGTRTTPTRKLIRKSASAKDIRHLSDRVALERVLGLTTSNKNGLTCNPYSGIIAYPAGCVIVLFNSRTNTQSHIINPEKKTLTAVAFSKDGKYLASGESGHNPRVRVWEIGDTFTQVAELNGHKFSINCVAFSPNLKYLVSIGDQHDMLVNIWNWRTGSKVACNKIGCKVRSVSFAENGSYFVTVGNRHVKFWYFDTEAGLKSQAPTPVAGRSGILGELRNNCFCDIACGYGDNASNTYAVTKSGLFKKKDDHLEEAVERPQTVQLQKRIESRMNNADKKKKDDHLEEAVERPQTVQLQKRIESRINNADKVSKR
eukprot:gene13288-14663_t